MLIDKSLLRNVVAVETEARTAVVGGGIAGLAAARRIQQAGGTPVVFETEDRVGGRIKTIRRDGFAYDVGAFIYLGSYVEAKQEDVDCRLGPPVEQCTP